MIDCFDEVFDEVNKQLELITVTSEGLAESKERAANFLVVEAVLIEYLRQIDGELAKRSSLKDATFANKINRVAGKNITERKINIATDEEYASIRESFEELDALREWVKGHIKIFENAHIMYRGFSREDR
ncbi:hypothetical protein A2Z67_05200 [Candidatus Woesebacteria bacterium RBG_13_36_22]|uniref:Four helix bundle protein n=1 Tax=Candidatus Woesebacteria bacterium RBG_13_36_22 TaxID=1802478 RepID=A0A1F7X3N5_9BACT|nr:MAG: hypothetical protein A2Z67_05200 [Candidatus Woesebacteria bacterium RBG_13_36_22]